MFIYIILLAIFMVIGILSTYTVSITVFLVLASLVGLLYYLGISMERIFMVMALGLLMGWLSLFIFHMKLVDLPYNQEVDMVGEITEVKDDYGATLQVAVIRGKRVRNLKVKLSSWEPRDWALGQIVVVRGDLEEMSLPTNPGQTNFRHVYYGQGLVGRVTVRYYSLVDDVADGSNSGVKASFLNKIRYKSQKHFINRIASGLSADYSGLALGMSIGDKSLLSEEDEEALRNLGLSHILVVSSLHVGLLLVLVNNLSTRLSLSMVWRHTVIIILMLMLLLLSVSVISLVKCLFIYAAHLIGERYNRKPFYLLSLAVYALWALFYNPYYVYNLSFTLSLMAYVGVFALYRYSWRKCPKSLRAWYVTLCIYMALMPIFIYNFKGIHYLGLLVTPLLMPSLEVVIVSNFLNTFIQGVYLVPVMNSLLTKLLELIRMVIAISQDFGQHFLLLPNVTVLIIFLYYICLSQWLMISYKKATRKVLYSLMSFMFIVYIGVTCVNYFPLRVFYLDVGMGDGQLIYSQGQSILIDGGTPYNARLIKNVLYTIGEKKADIGIISHEHQDHYGGILELMTEDAIETVYMTQAAVEHLKDKNKAVFDAYEKEGRLITLDKNTILSIKGGWEMKLYKPDDREEDPNNHSIVALLKKGDLEFLFTGDAEKEEEKSILPRVLEEATLPIEYLKVPHHGSKTSSTESFLLAAQPNYGMISVGQNNRYGLPDEEVIQRYEAIGTKLHRIDEEGALVVGVFGDWIWYEDY